MRLFADAYGLNQAQRQQAVPVLARRVKAMRDFLAGQAAAGAQPLAQLWHAGHGAPGEPAPATSPTGKAPGTTYSLTNPPRPATALLPTHPGHVEPRACNGWAGAGLQPLRDCRDAYRGFAGPVMRACRRFGVAVDRRGEPGW